jgi:excisionase family DNA binding protein
MNDELKILTPVEVAAVLRLNARSVLRLLRTGQLPGRKIAGKWRILESDLESFVSSPVKSDG